MSKPWLWTVLLLGLAGTIVLLDGTMVGWVLAVFVLALLLVIWLLPRRSAIRSQRNPNSVTADMAQGLLGLALGIGGAVLAGLFLPREWFSWLLIAIGLMLFGWLILSRR